MNFCLGNDHHGANYCLNVVCPVVVGGDDDDGADDGGGGVGDRYHVVLK